MTAVHTALEIRPSDLIPKVDPATLRKRLMAPQKRPVASKGDEQAVTVRTSITAPVGRVWTRQHDAHVRGFYEWKVNPPLGYLKMRCLEDDVAYEDIVGPGRKHALVEKRKALIRDVKNTFPSMSLPAIGRLFGGRDHTTILWSLGEPTEKRVRHEISEESVVALYNTGMKQKAIAERLNVSPSVISRIVNSRFPDRPKQRLMKDHADEIKAWFDTGVTLSEIGFETGFDPSAISKFVQRMGWTRP